MNNVNNNYLNFLIELANQADEVATFFFHKQFKISQKIDATLVTEADLKIETEVRKLALNHYPQLSILGEEFGEVKNSSCKLIIDPIDSTYNFVRGLPFFATLLAIEEDNEIVAGIVSSPITKERWLASVNQGAFYNNQKLEVSKIKALSKATVFHGSLFGAEAKEIPNQMFKIIRKTFRQRGFGDYLSHMLVAMGKGEFAFDFGVKPWDIAPIKIIVEEAGGMLTDQFGVPTIYSGNMISSNGYLHEEILKVVP
ncbi:MAG: inositol monophosphatase family protein [Candidatus Margulisiibacteriota bacterium]|jgi:histidinol-phosphatase